MTDMINSPSHYADAAVSITFEPVDLTERLPHPIASAVEYIIRAGRKESCPESVDLGKARWWLKRALIRFEFEDVKLDPLAARLLWHFVVEHRNTILLPLAGRVDHAVISGDGIKETIERIESRLEKLEAE